VADVPILRRSLLSADIADLIRDRILSGQLRPGDRVRLEPLAEQLAVSTMPVREALRQLAFEGLIDFHPHRGAVVAPLPREDLTDLWEVHAFTAGLAAERAATRLTDEDLAGLRDLLREFEDRLADPERLVEINHELHRRINRAGGSRKLRWLLGLANRYIPRSYYQFIPAWPEISRRDHRALMDALARRDGPAARAIAQDHVRGGGELLLDYLEGRGFWRSGPARPKRRDSARPRKALSDGRDGGAPPESREGQAQPPGEATS
jgi:DNA-binding GntR family transcriptional regulator